MPDTFLIGAPVPEGPWESDGGAVIDLEGHIIAAVSMQIRDAAVRYRIARLLAAAPTMYRILCDIAAPAESATGEDYYDAIHRAVVTVRAVAGQR